MKTHVKHWLQSWHDGELDETLVPKVKAHLAHCAECQQELDMLEQLSSVLHADDDVILRGLAEQSEDDFVNTVMQRIHEDAVTQESFLDSWLWNRIPVALIGLWLVIQTGWTIITGISTLDRVAPGFRWLNNMLQALDSGIVEQITGRETLASYIEQMLHIELLVDTILNPATLATVIIGLMFVSWFTVWYLHQEQRSTYKHITQNGGY